MQILKPENLAWWVQTLRRSQNISQDALAEASGLTVRTIQRIEAGERSTVTTRRALARGLGYDKLEVFDDPETILLIEKLNAEWGKLAEQAFKDRFPGSVRIPAERVTSGEQLGHLVEWSQARAFHYDERLSATSKDAAAVLFDFLHDYGDVDDCYSETQRLDVYKTLESLLKDLETTGAAAHVGRRTTQIVGRSWEDKTPLRLNIAYVVVDAANREIREIWGGKELSFGF